MKTIKNILKSLKVGIIVILLSGTIIGNTANAQLVSNVAVMNIDVGGIITDRQVMANLMRLELQKTGLFRVMSKYDMLDIAKEQNLKIENCYGITCIIEIGKAFKIESLLISLLFFLTNGSIQSPFV